MGSESLRSRFVRVAGAAALLVTAAHEPARVASAQAETLAPPVAASPATNREFRNYLPLVEQRQTLRREATITSGSALYTQLEQWKIERAKSNHSLRV